MQNKSIELTQSQIKAYENGATMFIFPIDTEIPSGYIPQGMSRKENKPYRYNMWNGDLKDIIFLDMPIQKGDKDIYIKESVINYKHLQESKEFHLFEPFIISECIDVRVVRVQDIPIMDMILVNKGFDFERFSDRYEHQLKEQNINRTYEDNDYVFLLEVKR